MHLLAGPLWFIVDSAPANVWTEIACTAVLLPLDGAGLVQADAVEVLASMLALLAWLFLGVIGAAIEC